MRQRNYLLASALCLVLALFISSPALALASTPRGNVTVVDEHDRDLPFDPVLRAGEQIKITVTGFAPRADVLVQVLRNSTEPLIAGTHMHANTKGRLTIQWVVPSTLPAGEHVLAFTGAPPDLVTGTPGSIGASVPNIGIVPFSVAGSGVDAVSVGPADSGVDAEAISAPATSSGVLAYTGIDVVVLVLLGCALLLAGAAVLSWRRARVAA